MSDRLTDLPSKKKSNVRNITNPERSVPQNYFYFITIYLSPSVSFKSIVFIYTMQTAQK